MKTALWSEWVQATFGAVVVAAVLKLLFPVQLDERSWRPWWIGLIGVRLAAFVIGRRRRR